MGGFWTIVVIFMVLYWGGRFLTAPMRSAASLKRIEEELKRRNE